MKNTFDNLDLNEISSEEIRKIDGGFVLELIAAVCAVVYLAGEMAEAAGRRHGNCDPK
jgi:hypothetical protein